MNKLIWIFVILVVLVTGAVVPVFLGNDHDPIDINRSSLNRLQLAVEIYWLDHEKYPSNSEGLSVLLEKMSKNLDQPYLKEVPTDDWGNPLHYYTYKDKLGRQLVMLWSFGADGIYGGDDDNRDIVKYLT